MKVDAKSKSVKKNDAKNVLLQRPLTIKHLKPISIEYTTLYSPTCYDLICYNSTLYIVPVIILKVDKF